MKRIRLFHKGQFVEGTKAPVFSWTRFGHRRCSFSFLLPSFDELLFVEMSALLPRHYHPHSVATTLQSKDLRRLAVALPPSTHCIYIRAGTFSQDKSDLLAALSTMPQMKTVSVRDVPLDASLLLHSLIRDAKAFHRLPAIFGVERPFLDDEVLLQTRWEVISVESVRTQLTFSGINRLLAQWVEGKREIRSVRIFKPKGKLEDAFRDLSLEIFACVSPTGEDQFLLKTTFGETLRVACDKYLVIELCCL